MPEVDRSSVTAYHGNHLDRNLINKVLIIYFTRKIESITDVGTHKLQANIYMHMLYMLFKTIFYI